MEKNRNRSGDTGSTNRALLLPILLQTLPPNVLLGRPPHADVVPRLGNARQRHRRRRRTSRRARRARHRRRSARGSCWSAPCCRCGRSCCGTVSGALPYPLCVAGIARRQPGKKLYPFSRRNPISPASPASCRRRKRSLFRDFSIETFPLGRSTSILGGARRSTISSGTRPSIRTRPP